MPSYVVPYAPTSTFQPNGRLVDLLRDQGSDQAQFALQHGAIDAQLAHTLGSIPGQAVQTYQEVQKSQLAQQALDEGAQRVSDLKALDAAFAQPGGRDQIIGTLPGHLRPLVTKQFLEADELGAKVSEAQLKVEAATGDYVDSQLQVVKAHGYDPAAMQGVISHAKQVYGSNPAMLAQVNSFQQALYQNPTPAGVQAIVDPFMAARDADKAKEFNLRANESHYDRSGKLIVTAPPAQPVAGSSDAVVAQLTKEELAKQGGIPGGAVQTVPAPTMPPGLPGALPTPAGPTGLNPQTGQPIIPEDTITGGSVNPIAPSLSPAAATLLQNAPIGTVEAPAPPSPSPGEVALAQFQRVKEAGMRATGDSTITIHTMVNGQPVERVITKEQALREGIFPSQPPAAIQVNNMLAAADAKAGPVTAQRPSGPSANVVDTRTGFTPNGLYQASIANALQGTMPALGLGQAPRAIAARAAVVNTAGALAAQAGTDLPTLRAEYKANASTLTRLLPQATATANANNTMSDNLDLALAKSADVARSGSKLVNRYLQWAQGELTPAKGLAEFETYVYTAAREYAKVTSGGAASSQGLTDSAAREASKLLNVAQAPEVFAGVVQAMKNDAGNVVTEQTKGLGRVSSTIANFFSVANGGGLVGGGPTTPPPVRPAPRKNPFE